MSTLTLTASGLTIVDRFLVSEGGYVLFTHDKTPGIVWIIESDTITEEILREMPKQSVCENDYVRGEQYWKKRMPISDDIEDEDLEEWILNNRNLWEVEQE